MWPPRYNGRMEHESTDSPAATRSLWAGTVAEFCRPSAAAWLGAIEAGHQARYGRQATRTQAMAWADSRRVLARALRTLIRERSDAGGWGMAFEYELPWEGGRRPDLVLLAGGQVLVVESKMDRAATAAGLDQVAAYARDLELYHGATHGRAVRPILGCSFRIWRFRRRA